MNHASKFFFALLAMTATACVNEGAAPDRIGMLTSALTGVSTSGVTYRLRMALFEVSGPESLQLDSEAFLGQSEISQELPVGAYQIQLQPGWTLEREEGGTFTVVDAMLTTPDTVDFVISDRQTTSISFGFRVEGDGVMLGEGALSVAINVEDSQAENTDVTCIDRVDNDGDGFIDCDDTDCSGLGACPPGLPQVGDLVISEVMADPSAAFDADGEWFELVNLSSIALQLDGCTITDLGGQSHVISSLTIPAGAIAVIGDNADPSVNGGIAFDYVASISLVNTADQIIVSCGGTVIDEVAWTTLALTGISRELSRSLMDALLNDDVSQWCPAVSTYGAGDLGTPGTLNDCP